MATDYGYNNFYAHAMKNYQPAMDAELAKTNAGLADQGLIASTAGQGTLADVRNKYLSAARQQAQEVAYNREQAAQQNALKVWEMLNSRALAWKQLMGSKSKITLPKQLTGFTNLQKVSFLPPTSGSGPVGDPKEQRGFEMEAAPKGATLTETNMNQAASDAAAGRALERARLALQQRQFDLQAKLAEQEAANANDPWQTISAMAFNNLDAADPTGATPGYQAAAQPSSLLNTFQAQFGIDVLDEARKGNERAIAVIKTMYPLSWRTRLAMEVTPSTASTPMSALSMPASEMAALNQRSPFDNSPRYDLASAFRMKNNLPMPSASNSPSASALLPNVR